MNSTVRTPAGVGSRMRWARVDGDVLVAARNGGFVGFVERTRSGRFNAFDGRATPVGHFDTLAEAKAAVRALRRPRRDRWAHVPQRLRRIPLVAATVAGGIAVTMTVTAGALAPYL